MGSTKAELRRKAIYERDGYRCVYCGRVFDTDSLTLDHVQPRVKHGDHSPGNLVTACVRCNSEKAGRSAWDWLSHRPEERENFLRHAVHVWPRLRQAVQDAVDDGEA
jgi:5-methylcytosine-specific restriction endonuclease McrA